MIYNFKYYKNNTFLFLNLSQFRQLLHNLYKIPFRTLRKYLNRYNIEYMEMYT